MQTSSAANSKHVLIQYNDERIASITYAPNLDFQIAVAGVENSKTSACSDFFPVLLDSMMEFFLGGKNPVPAEETIEIAAMVGQSIAAQESPNVWFDL